MTAIFAFEEQDKFRLQAVNDYVERRPEALGTGALHMDGRRYAFDLGDGFCLTSQLPVLLQGVVREQHR